MIDRRPIQQKHERESVDLFGNWFNREHHTDFRVIHEPNPPDAVLQSSSGWTCWVEVSSAFLNQEYAKDLYSFATLGEAHKPCTPRLLHEPDYNFAQTFVDVVKKKLEKQSYVESKERYGEGYLVVPLLYPLFNGQTITAMKAAWADLPSTVNDLGCFSSVYFVSNSNDPVEFLRLSPRCSLTRFVQRLVGNH
jgi:hypothetical protein